MAKKVDERENPRSFHTNERVSESEFADDGLMMRLAGSLELVQLGHGGDSGGFFFVGV